MSPALQCHALEIGYHSKGTERRVVAKDLDLDLRAGEFVCLLGPNGVGKSTLLRALAGAQKPLSGTVRLGEADLYEFPPKERARAVSVSFTDGPPMGMFTARALVALGRHPHTRWTGALSDRDHQRIDWALETLGASHLAERQVSELSDGERQKITIARALAQDTRIILLDEPTAFLDLPGRVDLMRTLRDLARQERLAILLSTHDLDLALRCADRLWLFDRSGNVSSGIPEVLALNGALAATFSSEKLDWDGELGSFRLHREPCDQVWLEGSGPHAIWTRRALMRLGFGFGDSPTASTFSIQIEESLWQVSSTSESQTFGSLDELIAWISDPVRYQHPHDRHTTSPIK